MQKVDINHFSFSQMFNSAISGKTMISAFTAFLMVSVGLLLFALLVCMILFTKDVDYIPSLITISAMDVSIIMAGATVIFGGKMADSKEILADINAQIPENSITSKIKSTVATIKTTEQKKTE